MIEDPVSLDGKGEATLTQKGKPSFAIPKIDFQALLKSEWMVPIVAIVVALTLCFYKLFDALPDLWFGKDGYYSHGILVPLISGFIIFRSWDKIKGRPVKPAYYMALPLLAVGWIFFAAYRQGQLQILSFSLVGFLLIGIVMVAGWQWLKALFFPTTYLLFGLPVFSNIIDTYTNPLQLASTGVAKQILMMLRFQIFQADSTTLHMDNFTLDVGIPCSGLKLMIAVTAFTVLFVLIGNLKWWANLMMFVAIIPLCLGINGLRIALIGIVGNQYGSEAGHQFHDYSGYITLVVCFYLLFKYARYLGWKD